MDSLHEEQVPGAGLPQLEPGSTLHNMFSPRTPGSTPGNSHPPVKPSRQSVPHVVACVAVWVLRGVSLGAGIGRGDTVMGVTFATLFLILCAHGPYLDAPLSSLSSTKAVNTAMLAGLISFAAVVAGGYRASANSPSPTWSTLGFPPDAALGVLPPAAVLLAAAFQGVASRLAASRRSTVVLHRRHSVRWVAGVVWGLAATLQPSVQSATLLLVLVGNGWRWATATSAKPGFMTWAPVTLTLLTLNALWVFVGFLFQALPASTADAAILLGFVRMPAGGHRWEYCVQYSCQAVLHVALCSLVGTGHLKHRRRRRADVRPRAPHAPAVSSPVAAGGHHPPPLRPPAPPPTPATRLQAALARGAGLGACVVAALAWTLAFPSFLALPLLLWAVWRGVTYRETPLAHGVGAAPALIAYTSAIVVGELVTAVYALAAEPAVFQDNVHHPEDAPPVVALFPRGVDLLGLQPHLLPGLRFLAQLACLGVLWLRVRAIKLLPGGTPRVTPTAAAAPPTLLTAVYAVAAANTQWVVLLGLYLLSLSHVDLIHAAYVIWFVALVPSPGFRRRHWRVLVSYNALALVVLMVWNPVSRLYDSGGSVPEWVLGPTVASEGDPSWLRSYGANALLFVLACAQAVQYDREAKAARAATSAALAASYPGWGAFVATAASFQVKYGMWLAYALFLALSLLTPISLRGAATLIITLLMLSRHLKAGVAAGAMEHRTNARWLRVMAVTNAVLLACRYVYQFDDLASWFDRRVWGYSFLKETELGLVNYHSSSALYVRLLDTIAMLLVSVGLARALTAAAAAPPPPPRSVRDGLATPARATSWAPAWLQEAGAWLQRRLYYLGGHLTLFVTFTVAATEENVMGVAFGVLCVGLVAFSMVGWGGRCCRRGGARRPQVAHEDYVAVADEGSQDALRMALLFGGVWAPVYLLAMVCLLARYAYQFSFFGTQRGARWYTGDTLQAQWWGLDRIAAHAEEGPDGATFVVNHAVTYRRVWGSVFKFLLIMATCALHRWAQSFGGAVHGELQAFKARLQRSRFNTAVPADGVPDVAAAVRHVAKAWASRACPQCLSGHLCGRSFWFTMRASMQQYAPRLLLVAAWTAALVSAFTHLNAYSLILIALMLVAAALRRGLRRALPALWFVTMLGVVLQFWGIVGWPPSSKLHDSWWPYNASRTVRYFVGVGPDAAAWQLIPDFATVLLASAAMHRHALFTATHHLFSSGGNKPAPGAPPVALLRCLPDAERLMWATLVVSHRLAWLWRKRAGLPGAPPSTPASASAPHRMPSPTWSLLTRAVTSSSINVILVVVFLVSASQSQQSLLMAGYFAFSVYLLVARQTPRGALAALRAFNLVFIAVVLLYQVPALSAADCSIRDTCFTWQTMVGVQKLAVVTVPGAPSCDADAAPGSNATCASPFGFASGVLTAVVLFVMIELLGVLTTSRSYARMQALRNVDRRLRAFRRERILREDAHNLHVAATKRDADRATMLANLRDLVARVANWNRLLQLAQFSAAAPPPPPPSSVSVAAASSPGAVVVSWTGGAASAGHVVVLHVLMGEEAFRPFAPVAKAPPGQSSALLTGLSPGRTIQVKVAAYNDSGVGMFSSASATFTLDDAPPPHDAASMAASSGMGGDASAWTRVLRWVTVKTSTAVNKHLVSRLAFVPVVPPGPPPPDTASPVPPPLASPARAPWQAPAEGEAKAGEVVGEGGSAESKAHPEGGPPPPNASPPPTPADDTRFNVLNDTQLAVSSLTGLRLVSALVVTLGGVLASHSQAFVVFSLVLNALAYSSLPSIVLLVVYLGWLGWEYPRAPWWAWQACLLYIVGVLGLKLFMQLPLFCMHYSRVDDEWGWRFWYQDNCSTNEGVLTDSKAALRNVQPVLVFFVRKYGEAYAGSGFLRGVFFDLVVMVALLFHRWVLQRLGFWAAAVPVEEVASEPALVGVTRMASLSVAKARGAGAAAAEALPTPRRGVGVGVGVGDVAVTVAGGGGTPSPAEFEFVDSDGEGEASPAAPPPTLPPSPKKRSRCGAIKDAVGCTWPSVKAWAAEFCDQATEEEVTARRLAATGSQHRLSRAVMPAAVHRFWLRVVDSPSVFGVKKPGHDLYFPTVCIQLFILLYIVFGWTSMFQTDASASLSSQLNNNQFSGTMVVAAIAHVGVMVVDRVAYLYRSEAVKAVLQWFLIAFVHGFIFFYIPLTTDRPFSQNPVAIVFYLVFVVYFLVSARQLFLSFSTAPPRDTLKSNGVKPPIPLFFRIYTAVPFLMEMQNLLDWCCANTSLDVFMHLQLKAIHTELFFTKSEMEYRKRDAAILTGRKPQAGVWKLLCGGLLFGSLLFVILFPALLFSTLNPILESNPVTAATLSGGLSSGGIRHTLLHITQPDLLTEITRVPDTYWGDLRAATAHGDSPTPLLDAFKDGAQVVSMAVAPASDWVPSPPELARLGDLLATKANATARGAFDQPLVEFTLSVTFTRVGPPDFETIQQAYRRLLTSDQCATLLEALRAPVGGGNVFAGPVDAVPVTQAGNITVDGLYSDIVRLPASTSLLNLEDPQYYAPVLLELYKAPAENGGERTWWQLQRTAPLPYYGLPGITFTTVSDKVAPSIISNLFGTYGVAAIYVGVVLAIGRLVRTALEAPSYVLMFRELEVPDPLLELCSNIMVTQSQTYEGHLVDEMHLYGVLIRLYRSPEILRLVTRSQATQVPDAPPG